MLSSYTTLYQPAVVSLTHLCQQNPAALIHIATKACTSPGAHARWHPTILGLVIAPHPPNMPNTPELTMSLLTPMWLTTLCQILGSGYKVETGGAGVEGMIQVGGVSARRYPSCCAHQCDNGHVYSGLHMLSSSPHVCDAGSLLPRNHHARQLACLF